MIQAILVPLLGIDWGGADWAEILIAAGTFGIASGVVFAAKQLGDTRRTRTVEIARLLAETWDSDELVEARRLVRSHATSESLQLAVESAAHLGTKDYYEYTRMLNFFEQVGVSFNENREALIIVNNMIGTAIISAWATWMPVIEHVWPDQPTIGENFRTLAFRMTEVRPNPQWAQRGFFAAMIGDG